MLRLAPDAPPAVESGFVRDLIAKELSKGNWAAVGQKGGSARVCVIARSAATRQSSLCGRSCRGELPTGPGARQRLDCFASLAMTGNSIRHCEERSDEAIQSLRTVMSRRAAYGPGARQRLDCLASLAM